MKMGPGVFWGIVLIILGTGILFKVLFGVNVFRVIMALVFIFIGVRMLIGRPAWTKFNTNDLDDKTTLFGDRVVQVDKIDSKEYNTIFGKTVYDFTEININADMPAKVEFNSIFGETIVNLPKDLRVSIKSDAVFASAEMPNGNTAAFSTARYESEQGDSSMAERVLYIEAHAVFGHIKINQ